MVGVPRQQPGNLFGGLPVQTPRPCSDATPCVTAMTGMVGQAYSSGVSRCQAPGDTRGDHHPRALNQLMVAQSAYSSEYC